MESADLLALWRNRFYLRAILLCNTLYNNITLKNGVGISGECGGVYYDAWWR